MYRRRVTSSPQAVNHDFIPSTVEEIFDDITGRRLGFLRAFTTEEVNLCLYAYPNGTWEVKQPSVEVPSNLPEPALGINFPRDGLSRIDWLTLVSAHSDSWLLSLASFFGSQITRGERNRLFDQINDQPTLYEEVTNNFTPSTVEEIFTNLTGRRNGFRRALLTDVDTFYASCGPEKENLCLYAYPSGTWQVTLPLLALPPEIPEPVVGINFSRDATTRRDWLQLVAVHCDCWLLSLAFFYGSRLSPDERNRLFDLINDHPTLLEEVTNNFNPSTVEQIFTNLTGRRNGFRRALFTDVDTLYASCGPEKENLCLYAYPSGTWEVSPQVLDLPPEIPEPVLGINFARDGMTRRAWLQFVAHHCDCWLLSLAFFYGSRLSRDESSQEPLIRSDQ
ncbi:unnamed protein product [Arabis nemorensis]|uniref:PHD finger protein ALFIN-LIKE n=1 Tax=Arabis nemorensis TaxID=586526 RepID=A0A565CI55_9BRAS|nr:unnamed protein product [Arabis nemorensis]